MERIIVYSIFLIYLFLPISYSILYDTYTGNTVDKSKEEQPDKLNTLFNVNVCTNDIKPCNETERRRIDGSCNNLKNPQRGAGFTLPYRVVPPVYSKGYKNRRSQCGTDEELKAPRVVRYETLLEGKASSKKFTHLTTYFLLFLSSDVGSTLDTVNYLYLNKHCCEEKGKHDDICVPISIEKNDPVHRFSDVHCMNLTRPYTYQYFNCTKDSAPVRIIPSTPHFDLSNFYNYNPGSTKYLREYKGGRFRVEIINGLIYPQQSDGEMCIMNKKPRETLCNKHLLNGGIGPNLFMIWLYRYHNFIATKLEEVNPHWSDDQIFDTSRDILIAIVYQIYFYQLLPALFGKKNLVRDEVILENSGFRDDYDENIIPQMSDEYNYVLRWFHVAQETSMQLYDANNTILETVSLVDFTTRTGFFGYDDHEAQIARGSFLQPTGKFTDYVVDRDIAQVALGELHKAFDLTAADVAKGRLFGLAPYVDYLGFCNKKKFQTFEDLLDVMDEENINRLKKVYKCPKDVDLIAGLWLERPISGGSVPSTLYCLMVEQLLRSVKSDRHWYERPNRPYAFTPEQLSQIRNSNMAKFMCTVAPGISTITKNPFQTQSDKNKFVNCNELPEIDFNAWKEQKNTL